MIGCPLAYVDPCKDCARYGTCAPSQTMLKLVELEKQIKELKQLLDRNSNQRYSKIS